LEKLPALVGTDFRFDIAYTVVDQYLSEMSDYEAYFMLAPILSV